MRICFNPNKDAVLVENNFFHQVIVSVYIPNPEGYFKDSFSVIKLCLNSLLATCHSQTFFTIANKGSCSEVVQYLNEFFAEGKIYEVIHSRTIGKLNAVSKALAGGQFTLITVTYTDVLFLNDWQKETYKVFNIFPKAVGVRPTPSFKAFKTHTSNIWFNYIENGSIPFNVVYCIGAGKPNLLLSPYYNETRRLLGDDYPFWSEVGDVNRISELIQKKYKLMLEPYKYDNLLYYSASSRLKITFEKLIKNNS